MAQINKSSDYFNTVTWTGDDTTSRAISGVGFQPDLTWIKGRSLSVSHLLQDAVRGTGGSYTLKSDATAGDGTNTQGNVSAFSADGFTVAEGSDVDHTRAVNNGSETYVSWNWLGANGTASNTDGSITSTVSANTTNGFSIVSYTGTGSNATVGHGLGVAPSMIIIKARSAAESWTVYHKNLTSASYNLTLNDTSAETNNPSHFNSTAPTSSVFSIGTSGRVNVSSQTQIAYCFAEKKGFSKFGLYTGNGSTDGTFIYTGFKPAFVIVKGISGALNWTMVDNKRDPFNDNSTNYLHPNTSGDEGVGLNFDFLSNGFKLRSNSSPTNGSGVSYIYMAFAENPLVGTNNIPATAR